MTRLRRWGLAALLLLLATSCNLGSGNSHWVEARRGELVIGVDVSGQLASTVSHPLGPPPLRNTWNFKISMMAPEGEPIEKGKPALGFDISELRRNLEEYANEADSATKELTAHRASARMALRENQLAVEQAEAAERKAKLKTAGSSDVVALNEIERAKLDHQFAVYATQVARRKLDARTRQDRSETARLQRVKTRAEQKVAQLRQEMQQMQVPAPIDGTVLYIVDWQNNKKKVGDSAWRAERIVEVVSLDHMKAEGEVDEMDASRVAIGQAVKLRLDANADVELTGKVVKIDDAVQRRAPEDPLKVVKLELELEPNADVELRPGMRFRGTVETERIPDVLVVPLDAVYANAEGAFVYLRDGNEAVARSVTLGRRGHRDVEVLSGLSAGDEVAIVDASDDEGDGK